MFTKGEVEVVIPSIYPGGPVSYHARLERPDLRVAGDDRFTVRYGWTFAGTPFDDSIPGVMEGGSTESPGVEVSDATVMEGVALTKEEIDSLFRTFSRDNFLDRLRRDCIDGGMRAVAIYDLLMERIRMLE